MANYPLISTLTRPDRRSFVRRAAIPLLTMIVLLGIVAVIALLPFSYQVAVTLGLVQGLAEFLPISSSAHLILTPWFFGWPDPGLTFDVALHIGTLAAVAAYFWRDWLRLFAAPHPRTPDGRLFWLLVVGAIPGGIAGILLDSLAQQALLPNYLALIGGDTFGITSNCTDCTVDQPNLVDQLEGAGKSWKAYMEAMPSPCFVGDAGTLYRQKHNPFIYFDSVRENPARCNKIVPFTEFASDVQANALPQFVWITPNMCNSAHDCELDAADAWLQQWVPAILESQAWKDNGALFITFDEGKSSSGCCGNAQGGHIATVVISPLGQPGFKSDTPYTHYSLLRTIETAWGLPPLGNARCDCAPTMADFFRAP